MRDAILFIADKALDFAVLALVVVVTLAVPNLLT